jgi:hypothetical protein
LISKCGCLKSHVSGQIPEKFKISGLCLIFKNKTDVGPSDNVVQLVKAHILHILFVVFEKNRNFIVTPANAPNFLKILTFLKNGKQCVQNVRLDELNNIVAWANISFIFKN